MKIVEMNSGEKVDYSLKKDKLTLNDELTLSLDKYQRDYEVTKDVMADGDGSLAIGSGRYYVAQVVIPAAEYEETVEEAVAGDSTESGSDNGTIEGSGNITTRTKKPLNTDDVELRLFSIEGILN
jgi:ATP-dependent protease HslVU (ClpYQ) peptidase subunit